MPPYSPSISLLVSPFRVLAKLLVITTADRSKVEQSHVKDAAKPAVKRQRKKLALVVA